MNDFKIVSHFRKTTKTGKNYISADLLDATGKTYEKVAIWSEFPDFDKLVNGSDLQGTIKVGQFGPSLSAGYQRKGPAPASSAAMGVMMERKQDGIRQAQDNKEMSIKLAGAMRDATLIVTSLFSDIIKDIPADQRRDRIQEELGFWRTNLLENWDENKGEIPF